MLFFLVVGMKPSYGPSCCVCERIERLKPARYFTLLSFCFRCIGIGQMWSGGRVLTGLTTLQVCCRTFPETPGLLELQRSQCGVKLRDSLFVSAPLGFCVTSDTLQAPATRIHPCSLFRLFTDLQECRFSTSATVA